MRGNLAPLVLLLLLVVLGAAAWLTQDPDHPAWDGLSELPAIGPAVGRLREGYRPAPPAPPIEPEVEYLYLGGKAPDGPIDLTRPPVTASPLGAVWVRSGVELRDSPGGEGGVVERTSGLRRMSLREQRGPWRRVSRVGLDGLVVQGWVRQADLSEPTPEELWQPEPVLPMPAVPPSEEVLALARELMGDDAREEACGPFRLITDVQGPLIERCPRLAGQLDGLYARRTGLDPVGDPAEAILLFDSHGAYLVFRTRISPESRRHAFAAPARGFVAIAVGGGLAGQVQSTLVHELVHLLNRRYLGPALPPWLDEGLAEELAISSIAADGTLTPDSLGRWEVGEHGATLLGGGQIALDGLRERMRRGGLPTLEALFELDQAHFQAEGRFRAHYSISAFWMRYLLTGEAPAGAAGFRAFLAAVAAGQRLDEQLLLTHLGDDWTDLEAGFRRWLDEGA